MKSELLWHWDVWWQLTMCAQCFSFFRVTWVGLCCRWWAGISVNNLKCWVWGGMLQTFKCSLYNTNAASQSVKTQQLRLSWSPSSGLDHINKHELGSRSNGWVGYESVSRSQKDEESKITPIDDSKIATIYYSFHVEQTRLINLAKKIITRRY